MHMYNDVLPLLSDTCYPLHIPKTILPVVSFKIDFFVKLFKVLTVPVLVIFAATNLCSFPALCCHQGCDTCMIFLNVPVALVSLLSSSRNLRIV